MGDRNQEMKMHVHSKGLGFFLCAALWMAAGGARAQVVPPLYVGNQTPVTNALGRNLAGDNGNPDSASRVEIRQTAAGGAVLPPDPATGEGNPANPLVQTSYLGHGVIGANTGLFSETFTNRLPTNSTYFARVYDAPSAGAALYYANSAPFAAPPSSEANVDVVFGALQLVSGEEDIDTDGDGIPDAMESEILGTSPTDRDTDGDGYSDYFEAVHREYMHAKEPDEPLSVQINPPVLAEIDPYTVSWDTIPVPGMQYRLEYTDALLIPEAFVEVWSGTATATNVEVDVDEWVRTNSLIKGFFRVLIP